MKQFLSDVSWASVLIVLAVVGFATIVACDRQSPDAARAAEEGQRELAGHAEEEVSDLDLPVEELLAAQCEHGIPTHTCDECRYEVGVVKVSPDLLDADGPLDTARVTLRAVLETTAFNGEVRLNEERSAYLSPRAAGTVRSIDVDLGRRVRRGQVLFTVDSPEFAEARAEFIRARADAKLAGATLEREEDLNARKICPLKDLLEARAQHEQAQAGFACARERLVACGLTAEEIERTGESDREQGGALPVTAPFDGTVLERNLGLGAAVEPGQPLLLIGDTSRMWVITSLYERELATILERQAQGEVRAAVEVPAYAGRTFPGRVDRVSGTLDEATRTARVRVVVENPQGLLRAGMFARVHLEEDGAARVPSLPEEAVLEDEGRAFVFVPALPPYFVRRPVTVGRTGNGWVEIAQGLTGGETVVTRGAFILKSDVLRSKMGAGCAD
jgi:cobalt-zinc-cadmium efflux system membrane fusion protein